MTHRRGLIPIHEFIDLCPSPARGQHLCSTHEKETVALKAGPRSHIRLARGYADFQPGVVELGNQRVTSQLEQQPDRDANDAG